MIPPSIASWVLTKVGRNIEMGHYLLCYLRNFLGAILVYYGTAAVFHYHCYIHPRSKQIFANRPRPTWNTMWDQIKLAQASMTMYTLLPVFDEFLVETGWTQVYYTVHEIGGWVPFCLYTILYFALVEIGIYWMHRTLHTNKFLYKHVHMMHHKYNRPETLTPWCSIAFHPLDGILQASPYVLVLPLVPCHYGLHFAMLFFTAIWATYIHDSMDFNIDPIMGSKYHTVHHTHYIYNYGQVFTFCDQIWGTFKVPDGPTGIPSSKSRGKLEPTSRMVNKKTKWKQNRNWEFIENLGGAPMMNCVFLCVGDVTLCLGWCWSQVCDGESCCCHFVW